MFVYSINPETNRKHIYDHNVFEDEIEEAFFECSNYFVRKRKDNSHIIYCRLRTGRFLQIIYRELRDGTYLIITAYDIERQNIIDLLEDIDYEDY